MEKILDFLQSDIMVGFYIKYSISYITCEVIATRLKNLAQELGYVENKKTIQDHIKEIFITCILFVPYVGWGLVALFALTAIADKGDVKTVICSGRFHKIDEWGRLISPLFG